MLLAEPAYAKINLALHVRRRCDDGYHDLETLFAFAESGDLLHAEEGIGLAMEIVGPFAGGLDPDEDNLVLRAARALRGKAGITRGAAIRLDKRLPVASGIGGGSADAAAALRLLDRLWGTRAAEADLLAIAAALGSDVPACIRSTTALGRGRGEQLEPADPGPFAQAPLLLVNPGVKLSTAAVFARWDGIDRGALGGDIAAARNDLEPPARALEPPIGDVLGALDALPGVTLSRMSGSGATCFALFGDEALRDAGEAVIRAAHPDWWCLASRLR